MASWADFEAAHPEFASRVRALMASRKHLTMASLPRVGSRRNTGTQNPIEGGKIRIGSMTGHVKAIDLRRDPRVAIHGPTEDPPPENPRGWKGEAKVAGTAVEVVSGGEAHRFHIDIQVDVITQLNDEGTRLVVESWNPERGYRRHERQ
jgi:hypothetical protein